jgi:hypothetical protein
MFSFLIKIELGEIISIKVFISNYPSTSRKYTRKIKENQTKPTLILIYTVLNKN